MKKIINGKMYNTETARHLQHLITERQEILATTKRLYTKRKLVSISYMESVVL